MFLWDRAVRFKVWVRQVVRISIFFNSLLRLRIFFEFFFGFFFAWYMRQRGAVGGDLFLGSGNGFCLLFFF